MSVLLLLRNPELAEREEATGVGDVVPVADLDHSRILYGAGVETVEAGAKNGLVTDSLEIEPVGAGRQPEVTLILRVRFGGPVQKQNLPIVLVVPRRRVEYGQVLPRMRRIRAEDWIAVKAF